MRSVLALTFVLFCAHVWADEAEEEQIAEVKDTVLVLNLYLGGGIEQVPFHLGVLSAVEHFNIPVDTVIGTGFGEFVGALWSAGWNAMQIDSLLKSWEDMPASSDEWRSALWRVKYLISHKQTGELVLRDVRKEKPYLGGELFSLRKQEILWRSDIGKRVSFRAVDSSYAYPFPGDSVQTGVVRVYSTPVALRDTNGSAADRFLRVLQGADSSLVVLRPHSKPDSDSLFRVGVQVVQSNLGRFSAFAKQRREYESLIIPPQRFLYTPVLDSVSSEIQGHLNSFWNMSDTGFISVVNFLQKVQKDGSYYDMKLTLDTGSYLQVNALYSPQASLSLFGVGGSLFGANAGFDAGFYFINQFGYRFNVIGYYGQGVRGALPEFRSENLWDGGSFFIRGLFLDLEPTDYFQKSTYQEARILKENRSNVTLGVESDFVKAAVELSNERIISGASYSRIIEDETVCISNEEGMLCDVFPNVVGVEYTPIRVRSMFPYVEWLWQSEAYNRWFSTDGFMAMVMGGFRAVSVKLWEQEAPLYFTSKGVLSLSKPVTKYISLSGSAEYGVNMRRAENSAILFPDELFGANDYDREKNYDPALDNHYRFVMSMGDYGSQWPIHENTSHRYGLVSAGLSLHYGENGLFLMGGYAKDYERNKWSFRDSNRFWAEPQFRLKTETFDVRAGISLLKGRDARYFISVGDHI